MRDLLKYGLIASAGQPRSLTGEALIGLGALLSQMDFDFSKDEVDLDAITDQALKDAEQMDLEEMEADLAALDTGVPEVDLSEFKTKQKSKVTQKLDKVTEKPIINVNKPWDGSIFADYKYGFLANNNIKDGNATLEDFLSKGLGGINLEERIADVESGEIYIPNAEQEKRFARGKFKMSEREAYIAYLKRKGISGGGFGGTPATTSVNQITTDPNSLLSPNNRLKPEVLQILDGARYKNKGKDDTPLHRVAHVTNSPYLRTDNVDYRQMRQATAPGYTGEIGKAAIEGYNLVIDKYNYDQAVKADYEEEIEDQMGSLNVEADFLTDQARQDYLELSMGKKKRLNEAFNSYANGDISKLDYENVKASLVSELQSAAATRTNITNSIKDFIENKGTIDTEASDPEMLDFLMTGEKSPERISIKSIDGVDYITGTTRGGRDFQIPTSKIANGTAGFRVVKKASLAPVISGALKNINAYTSTVKTDLGFGISTPNAEKARDIGIASIRTNLGSNEADLRSIMSQIYGVNHTAYQNFLGSDPTANKSAMLDDAAEYLYDTQVAEKYFPMTKTTKFRTEKTGGTTAGEREIAQTKANFDKLGAITQGNYQKFLTAVPDFRNKYRTIGPKDGVLQVGDLKGNLLVTIDFSNPEQAKTDLASLAGVAGYQNGQVQNKLTEEQIKARASQFLSNAGL